jgi:hypothetical protein
MSTRVLTFILCSPDVDAEQQAMVDLHYDADGFAVLVGPDCPWCKKRLTARYRCTACQHVVEAPGEFRWSWQGRSHYHQPDDSDRWHTEVMEHWNSHGGQCVLLPIEDKE